MQKSAVTLIQDPNDSAGWLKIFVSPDAKGRFVVFYESAVARLWHDKIVRALQQTPRRFDTYNEARAMRRLVHNWISRELSTTYKIVEGREAAEKAKSFVGYVR